MVCGIYISANPKESISARNFKLSQQTSYGRISALATDAGTISDI